MIHDNRQSTQKYQLPPLGNNPSSNQTGTNPGSFAQTPVIQPGVAGRMTYSSPDTPGMPEASDKTAWDFMPYDWKMKPGFEENYEQAEAWQPPEGFVPSTQLESARVGIITPE